MSQLPPTFLGAFRAIIRHNPLGLQPVEIAALLGIDHSTLWRYCQGEVFPGWPIVLALAYIFGFNREQVRDLKTLYVRDSQDKPASTTAHQVAIRKEKETKQAITDEIAPSQQQDARRIQEEFAAKKKQFRPVVQTDP